MTCSLKLLVIPMQEMLLPFANFWKGEIAIRLGTL